MQENQQRQEKVGKTNVRERKKPRAFLSFLSYMYYLIVSVGATLAVAVVAWYYVAWRISERSYSWDLYVGTIVLILLDLLCLIMVIALVKESSRSFRLRKQRHNNDLLPSPDNDKTTRFIFYAPEDAIFAEQLRADLHDRGLDCGFRLTVPMEGAKRVPLGCVLQYDQMLLVLSEHTSTSKWVEKAVKIALDKERLTRHTALFPLYLRIMALDVNNGWSARIHNSHKIEDFTGWEQQDQYQQALDQLVNDLKARFNVKKST